MTETKKSAPLVDKIMASSTKPEAISTLNEILKSLYLSSSYLDLVAIKDKLEIKKTEYKVISDTYRSLASPKSYEDIHAIRVELNFLYRDINDDFSFEINRLKMYYEERKTVIRAASSVNLKKNEEFTKNFSKSISESLLRDYVGFDKGYDEWTSCASTSYGLWQELTALLNSVRMLTDSLASEEKHALLIQQQDAR